MTSNHGASGFTKIYDNVMSFAGLGNKPRRRRSETFTTEGSGNTLYDAISRTQGLSHFKQIVDGSPQMVELLKDPSKKLTLFACSNSGIYNLNNLGATMDAIKTLSRDELVGYQIVPLVLKTTEMKYGVFYVKTVQGERLKINGMGIAYPKIGSRHMATSVGTTENYEANLFQGDILCSNGVLHIVSNMLVPESAMSTAI